MRSIRRWCRHHDGTIMIAVFLAMVLLVEAVLLWGVAAADCDVAFDCGRGRATIGGKSYPIMCGRQTGRGIEGGSVGGVIRANGKWRPGLVAPGTVMITTSPRLCYDCFIHVADVSRRFSNGCIGITAAGFNALKACQGAKFSIASK